MAEIIVRKVDWQAVAQKIAADKKRIVVYKNTDQQHLINDITFIAPDALRVQESRG